MLVYGICSFIFYQLFICLLPECSYMLCTCCVHVVYVFVRWSRSSLSCDLAPLFWTLWFFKFWYADQNWQRQNKVDEEVENNKQILHGFVLLFLTCLNVVHATCFCRLGGKSSTLKPLSDQALYFLGALFVQLRTAKIARHRFSSNKMSTAVAQLGVCSTGLWKSTEADAKASNKQMGENRTTKPTRTRRQQACEKMRGIRNRCVGS